MNTERAKRKLSAILSADVKGYSRLMGEDEVGTVRTLKEYREVMSKLIKEYRGRVVDSPGDNILAEFASVVDALECSIEIQKELKAKNAVLPDNRKMQFRIGVNLGDVIEDEDKVYGDGVNIAARIEGLADPGGICISGSGFEQVRNKLRLGFQYLGEHTVKNIAQPIKVYRVLMEPESAGKVIGEKGQKGRRWRWAAAVAVFLVVAALALWSSYFRRPPIEPASRDKMAFPLPDKPSIAVLPFANMSGDPKEDYFSDGLTEQIITSLSMVPRLFVIARNSTFVYKGKAVKVQTVAEEQGVRYVLEGGVQKSQDRVRITAQLIDAIKGHHLWSERYDRELKDLFALQDEIVRQIMTGVQVKLTEGQSASAIAGSTSNLKALECYWRALEHYNRWSREDNAAARQWLEKAIELDPNFAGAWALLGVNHFYGSAQGWSKSPAESMKRAQECAQKALSINQSTPLALSLMGGIRGSQGKRDEALEYQEKALALNPNDPRIMWALALTLEGLGRLDEAIALGQKILRVSPYYPAMYLSYLASVYPAAGRYQETIQTCELLLERSRKGEFSPLYAHLFLAEAYVGLGQMDKARAEAEEVMKIDPKYSLEGHKRLTMYKDPAIGERRLAALRKAGLPDKPPLPLPDKPSIAVLPFVNMSEDKSQEYFSDGLTEEIITALSKSPQLFVIARNSSFVYKGKPVNVQQVSRELGVKYVLEGSVRRNGDQLRITAQLIDGTTGNHLWAERYDRELKDIFAIQDEVTLKVLTAIRVKLTEGELSLGYGKYYEGKQGLNCYLKIMEGNDLVFRHNTKDNNLARRIAEEALAMCPEVPMAHLLMAYVHSNDYWFDSTGSPQESVEKAIELVQKALALDDTLAEAHSLLGYLYTQKKEYEKGIAEGERAVSLNSGLAAVLGYYGFSLSVAGRAEEAIPLIEKAIRLNPFGSFPSCYNALGNALMFTGRYEEAVSAYKKYLESTPNFIWAHVTLAATYSMMGREKEAQAEAAEVLSIDPKFSLDFWAKTALVRDQSIRDKTIEALRKAGLK